MVVDDSVLLRYMMKRFLDDAFPDIAIVVAGEGGVALDMYREAKRIGTKIDLILTDCKMPHMDGYELVRIIRKEDAVVKDNCEKDHVKIVGISAYIMESDELKCYEAGMDDILAKPVGRQTIVELVRRMLRLTEKKPPTESTSL